MGNILESTSDNRTVDLPGIRWISDKNRWHKRRKARREAPTVSRISASVFVVCPCVRSLGTPKIHHNPPSIPSIWEIELPTDTFWAGIASSTTQVAGKTAEPLFLRVKFSNFWGGNDALLCGVSDWLWNPGVLRLGEPREGRCVERTSWDHGDADTVALHHGDFLRISFGRLLHAWILFNGLKSVTITNM